MVMVVSGLGLYDADVDGPDRGRTDVKHILALDQGTTSSRAIVFDRAGSVAATKLQWLLTHVRGASARARAGELAFGTVDSWLVWNLTGGRQHVTDPSNASRTMLFNIHTGDWDDDLLRLFGVPRAILPEVRS